ncbi:MAG TPA: hypothetical protein VMS77_07955, partial [Conexivisphaerales archaeon]|nr:hypothetical protein [Conexivisphaerales archaeon]
EGGTVRELAKTVRLYVYPRCSARAPALEGQCELNGNHEGNHLVRKKGEDGTIYATITWQGECHD